ncbi:MAG TPA: hypothetical protein VMK65_08450, partial [Longimicrobiales bacterium]|nr:hypothetical protein [Longimicrobiales bacterium]
TGSLVSVRLQHALDSDLTLSTAPGLPRAPVAFGAPFTSAFVDARHFMPVSYRATLALRALAGGALEGTALPPQMQHALGGVGSLPGYRAFQLDCGARAAGAVGADGRYPLYGCDRVALFQAEYRGGVDIHVGEGDLGHGHHHWDMDLDFDWALFFDAGRGWAFEGADVTPRAGTRTLYDAGVGLLFGDDVGLYWAVPLSGDGGGSTFFVRLGRRF